MSLVHSLYGILYRALSLLANDFFIHYIFIVYLLHSNNILLFLMCHCITIFLVCILSLGQVTECTYLLMVIVLLMLLLYNDFTKVFCCLWYSHAILIFMTFFRKSLYTIHSNNYRNIYILYPPNIFMKSYFHKIYDNIRGDGFAEGST